MEQEKSKEWTPPEEEFDLVLEVEDANKSGESKQTSQQGSKE